MKTTNSGSRKAPYTRQDWERLPEEPPTELILGELVREATPTYGHQVVAARIRHALVSLLDPERVPDTPAGVLVDERTVLQPDVVVLARPGDVDSPYVGVPVLAVEVLSPSTARRDRGVKAGLLLGAGVEEVWLVDPRNRTIDVRRTDGSLTVRAGEEARSRAVSDFRASPEVLFRPPDAPPR